MTPADKASSERVRRRLTAFYGETGCLDTVATAEGSEPLTVSMKVHLVDKPSGQCREQTTAEEIAGRYDNRRIKPPPCALERQAKWTHWEGLRSRYEFADRSAIVIGIDGWALGFTGHHLACVCWPVDHPNHEEHCEEAE